MKIAISPVKINHQKVNFQSKKASREEKDKNTDRLILGSLATGIVVVAGYFFAKIKFNIK